MRRAALFDLDRTLLAVNSGRLWFRRERAQGRLGLRQLLEAGVWMGLYEAGLLHAPTALGRAVRALAGEEEAELERRTRSFFEEELLDLFAPGGLEALEAHRAAGDLLVLLTSSSSYLSSCVEEHLGLDDGLAMHFEVEGGRFTGGIEQLCFGPSKVTVAEAWARENDVDLDQAWFYTDSISDLPMLERVGEPRVVAPDRRLAKVARRRGWQVLDWSRAGAAGSA